MRYDRARFVLFNKQNKKSIDINKQCSAIIAFRFVRNCGMEIYGSSPVIFSISVHNTNLEQIFKKLSIVD